MNRWINNFEELAITDQRRKALQIAEAAYDAIDTIQVIRSAVSLRGDQLKIRDHFFDLSEYSGVHVIGFGKAANLAAQALEEVIGARIKGGLTIGLKKSECKKIQCFVGTHPRPTEVNVEVGEKIYEFARSMTEKDLVIVIVSGGGSALLCWPLSECKQGIQLYEEFVKTPGNIRELDTIRKHMSAFKGGELAKLLYPATVIGLIFSDIPGAYYNMIASGPTYKDDSTVYDAEKIIGKYGLSKYELRETTKDDKYFEKVHNIPMVNNIVALEAMARRAESLGLTPNILTAEQYGNPDETVKDFLGAFDSLPQSGAGHAILAGGEISLVVTHPGKGGRVENLAMRAIEKIGADNLKNDIFVGLASDGLDNSDCAGIIADHSTFERIQNQNLSIKEAEDIFDGYDLFEKTGKEMIFTGPTGSNVSDLMFWVRF